jgi:hypothetical protein
MRTGVKTYAIRFIELVDMWLKKARYLRMPGFPERLSDNRSDFRIPGPENAEFFQFGDKVARATPVHPKDRRYICKLLGQPPWPDASSACGPFLDFTNITSAIQSN